MTAAAIPTFLPGLRCNGGTSATAQGEGNDVSAYVMQQYPIVANRIQVAEFIGKDVAGELTDNEVDCIVHLDSTTADRLKYMIGSQQFVQS